MAAGAVAVALLWPCVALVRGTTADDWYAAVKLTVTEAMIAVGFNSFEPTRYRAPDGTSFPITRGGLVRYPRLLLHVGRRDRVRVVKLITARCCSQRPVRWDGRGCLLNPPSSSNEGR